MTKTAAPVRLRSHPPIATLLHELAGGSRDWAEAELALTRAEFADLRQRSVSALYYGLGVAFALLCAVFVLAQAGVAALAPYLGGVAGAGLAIGVALLVIAGVCALAMRRLLSWRAESLAFRWLTSPPDDESKSR